MRRARELAPDYPVMEVNPANSCSAINRPVDALEAVARADFQPWLKRKYGVAPFWVVSDAHHMLGNYSAELAEAVRGRQHYPDDFRLRAAEARALIGGKVARSDARRRGQPVAAGRRVRQRRLAVVGQRL